MWRIARNLKMNSQGWWARHGQILWRMISTIISSIGHHQWMITRLGYRWRSCLEMSCCQFCFPSFCFGITSHFLMDYVLFLVLLLSWNKEMFRSNFIFAKYFDWTPTHKIKSVLIPEKTWCSLKWQEMTELILSSCTTKLNHTLYI
jgi:hypothetical protein